MLCGRCRAENREGRRFCAECGAPLGGSCPACGFPNALGEKFCGGCGVVLVSEPAAVAPRFGSPEAYTPKHLAEKILTSRAALEGEHKQVTVLFCDVAQSTQIAERLGPERTHALLNAFFELALAEVHRYEGTINQFLGDGFMALFGAPIAYEDHATRAVLAALGIRRRLRDQRAALATLPGEDLVVRMGLNTGLVVVGSIGDNLRMDYTAVGDTTNMAARMQQAAEPGTIVLSEATYRLVQRAVRAEGLGPVRVKGKPEPVLAWSLGGLASRRSPVELLAERRLGPFVGRHPELGALADLLERVQSGQGQVVGIVGEAGIGKSRLLYEFRRSLAERRVTYLEGHCLPYGATIPYLPVLDHLRNNCGIVDTDTPEVIAAKVRFALEEIGLDPDEGTPRILSLLGVKLDGDPAATLTSEALKAGIFETLRQMALAGSRHRPVIFVVEDLHWVDRASEEYFTALAEDLASAPIMLLATYRPGYRPPWMDRSFASQLALRPLPSGESRELVRAIGSEAALPGSVEQAVLAKAEGNPLFLEELARAVREHGELAIPDTIQAILTARIDRLAEAPKRLLQTAAVLGREIPLSLLEAIWDGPGGLEPHLAELKRREFLYQPTRADEPTYVFKHALIQEVAYAALLTPRRQALHAAAGRALERLYEGRVREVVELLAHHFGRSGDDARAVDYALLAAEKAQRAFANTEALSHFEAAVRRLDAMPDTGENRRRRIDAVLKQAEVKWALGRLPEHIEALEWIRPLVEEVGDPPRRAAWYAWTGILRSLTGEPTEIPIAYCQKAAAIAENHGLDELRALAESCLLQVYTVSGDLRAAHAAGERALEIFEAGGNIWWASRTLWNLSAAANGLGLWEQSLACCRRALAHGQAVKDRRLQIVGWYRLGSAHVLRGELAEGLRCLDEATALGPSPIDTALIQGFRGHALVKAGDPAAGVASLAEAVDWFERSALRYSHAIFSLRLAEGELRHGDRERARARVERLLATCRELRYRHIEGMGERLLAECLAPEHPEAAAAHLEAAASILDEIGARNEFARVLAVQGRLRQAAGDPGAARALLEHALAIFEALGTVDEPPAVRAALAALEASPRG